MIPSSHKIKVEYGDFQTPLELAKIVCQHLLKLGVVPDIIIEPTCGVGNFIKEASSLFPLSKRIFGFELNQYYIEQLLTRQKLTQDRRINLHHTDFFNIDWLSFISDLEGDILVLGNFPWVTNSQQGSINGENLPNKCNFQNHRGFDAITGKSNFDISEWMLIQMVKCLQGRDAYLAMICKVSVARKLLNYIHSQSFYLADCATYSIDAKKYFNANVEACLLFCKFDRVSRNYFCNVFNSFNNSDCYQIGYQNNLLIRDIDSFEKLKQFYTVNSSTKWRSGIKHDCSNIMEFRKVDDIFINGIGESVELEDIYLFPLLKGSDVAQNRIRTTEKYVLVTQRFIGEPTDSIKSLAPKTWQYLESHAQFLENRKSKIYQNNPRFSIFGVGAYTFTPWKIAICGLYKKLEFRLIGEILDKSVVFDDTVYFLSFENKQTAQKVLQLLTLTSVVDFYSSLIFWDEKRPIKSSILNRLDLVALAKSKLVGTIEDEDYLG